MRKTGEPIRSTGEARDLTSHGVLELTLGACGYDWRFVPAIGSFTDTKSASFSLSC